MIVLSMIFLLLFYITVTPFDSLNRIRPFAGAQPLNTDNTIPCSKVHFGPLNPILQ